MLTLINLMQRLIKTSNLTFSKQAKRFCHSLAFMKCNSNLWNSFTIVYEDSTDLSPNRDVHNVE